MNLKSNFLNSQKGMPVPVFRILLLGRRDFMTPIKNKLEGLGHDVEQCEDIREGVTSFDAVLFDFQLTQEPVPQFESIASASMRVVDTAAENTAIDLNDIPVSVSARELQLSLYLLLNEQQIQASQFPQSNVGSMGSEAIEPGRSGQPQVSVQRVNQAALNQLLSTISRDLFSALPQRLDDEINAALAQIGALSAVDRCYVFRYSPEQDLLSNSFEWCNQGIEPQIQNLQGLDAGNTPAWMTTIHKDQAVVIDDVDELNEDWAAERAILQAQSIQSLLAVPMRNPQGLCGFMGFDVVAKKRHWLPEEQYSLRLFADLVGLALQNRESVRQLQASEYRWKFALDGSGQGVWDWNARTDEVYFSARWKQMLGYSDDELGASLDEWTSRIHPDDLAATLSARQGYLEGRVAAYRHEHRVQHKNGQYIWMLDRGVIVSRDQHGNALRMIGTHTDVTESREIRQRIVESEMQLNAIFENSQVGIMVLTGYRRLARCNQRMADIAGYASAQEMIGISMRDLHVSEQHFIKFGERYYENLRLNNMLHIEYPLRRLDGQAVWCSFSGKAIDTATPPDLNKGVIWVVDDIEHIKQAERELREQRDLFSGGPTMVFQWRPEHGWPVEFCSANVSDLLGYDISDLLDGSIAFASLIHPDDLERIGKEVSYFIETGIDTYEQDYRLRHAHGHYLYVYDYTRLQRDESGQVRLIYGYLLDITDRKRAEAEHLRLEREIQQSRKMEALGQLSGGVAHEFNNMLAIMHGHLALLSSELENHPDPKLLSYVNNIEQAGHRATQLTRQMLAYSRPTERKPERIALNASIQQAIGLSRASLPSSISIEFAAADDLPDIRLDTLELQQIMTNLLINARDAMEGKGHLRVATRYAQIDKEICQVCQSVIDSAWVQVCVTDNGHGIARENLERLFEPFFTTKEVGKGTGLGLAVVQALVERNGGHILLDSEPGRGTTFRLLFPPVTGRRDVIAMEPAAEQTISERTGRILIVDDEPLLTMYLSEMLSPAGHEVTTTNSSIEALQILQSQRCKFDILITDQTMPGILGTELVGQAKTCCTGLLAILCTGHSEIVDAGNAQEFGIDCFLHKPVDPDELDRCIQKLLEQIDNTINNIDA
jgi:PAS domain S-box-containing protein